MTSDSQEASPWSLDIRKKPLMPCPYKGVRQVRELGQAVMSKMAP